MGRKARSEAYSKVSPSTRLCGVFSVANITLSMPRWRVTGIPLVPSMILQLVDSPEWAKTDTSSVETAGSGAAFLPPELRAKFQSKVKSNFMQGYGSSEAVRVP